MKYRTAAEYQRVSGSNSGVDTAAAQASAPLLWGTGAELAVAALVTAQAGRKLPAGSKAPRPKPVREVAGATRPGQVARYMWAQLLARIYGVFALQCSRCGALTAAGDEWTAAGCSGVGV